MGDTEADDAAHSTATDAERRRLRRRFFGSLVLLGLLLGWMVGRLMQPEPVRLQRVEASDGSLVLHLSGQPEVRDEHRAGTYAVLFDAKARGEVLRGQLQVDGRPVNWQLRRTEAGLLLSLVAARPLRGRWHGDSTEEGYRLEVEVESAP